MKRTFLILVSAAVLLGIQQGYVYFSSSKEIAMPLHTDDGQCIQTARDIQQEGKNLFLISNGFSIGLTVKETSCARSRDPKRS